MTTGIPINEKVLRWARETAGLSEVEVARKLKKKLITAETIKDWEQGKGGPTYSQLEQLAYKIYNRPLALFFFPVPPDEITPKQSFRTLPDQELNKLSPRMCYLIRIAHAMQLNLDELYDSEVPTKQFIAHDLKFSVNSKIDNMVSDVRQYLGIDPSMVYRAFLISAATFGATSLAGYVTKLDLSGFAAFFMMASIGIIIAMLVNVFFVKREVQTVEGALGVLRVVVDSIVVIRESAER
jgi:transcriptional regulator with XRE-family HTH domain